MGHKAPTALVFHDDGEEVARWGYQVTPRDPKAHTWIRLSLYIPTTFLTD